MLHPRNFHRIWTWNIERQNIEILVVRPFSKIFSKLRTIMLHLFTKILWNFAQENIIEYIRKKKKTGIRSFAAAQSNRSIEWSTRHLRDRKQLVRRTSVNLWTAEGFVSVSWSFGALEDCEWLSFYAAPAELVTRHRFPTGLQARKIGRRNWHRFKIPHKKIEQRDHLQSRGKNIVDKLLRRCYLIEAAILKIRYPIL